jgi:hypothetical protein
MSSVQGVSLWQQDQNYWSQSQAQSSSSSAQSALIGVISTAMVDQAKGLASIANGTALKRVNSALSAAVQNALQVVDGDAPTSSSSTSSSSSSSSSSTASTPATPTPAQAVGTVPLTTGTSLATLGILAGGTIAVTTAATTTNYTSTGTDTVGDLINALNIDLPTNAQVTASLNGKGQLVITARNTKESITVSGSGIDASVLGFGVGHQTFSPIKPKTTAATTGTTSSSSSTSSSASTASTSSKSSSTKKTQPTNDSSAAENSFKTAASLLSASGVSGSLIDMLA